jgi:hypothetical protein
MAIRRELIEKCRNKLEEVASKGERISYGQLMSYLQIPRSLVGECLNPIYEAAVNASPQRADLTLLVHYVDSPFGRYHSRGSKAQSVDIDPSDEEQVRTYKSDLRKVYAERGVAPSRTWKTWLES